MKKIKNNPIFKLILIVILASILELTVFNYRHYLSIFNEPINLSYDTAENGTNKVTVRTNEIYKKLNNVYLDIDSNYIENIQVFAKDDSNEVFEFIGNHDYSSDIKASKYLYLALDGNVKELEFQIISKDYDLKVLNIIVNAKVPIIFNIFRIIVVSILLVLYSLFNTKSKLYKTKLLNKPFKYLTILVIVQAVLLGSFYRLADDIDTLDSYNQLTNAFIHKRLYVSKNRSTRLRAMDNPYDYSYRTLIFTNTENVYTSDLSSREELDTKVIQFYTDNNITEDHDSYRWDYSYYNDKYYVYFGVGPVLTTYLPVKLIAKKEINTSRILYLMLLLTSISFIYLIYVICRKYFKDISLGLFYIITFTSLNGLAIFGIAEDPSFYNLPIIYGLFSIITALALTIRFIDSKNTSILYFIVGYLMSFTALCRPHYLLASILLLPFIITRLKSKKIPLKQKILELVLLMIPYMINGIICCTYNYLRFNNIFEFGASYQLTIEDCLHRTSSINKLIPIIEYYLLIPPKIMGSFPFIEFQYFNTSFLGHMTVEYIYGGVFLTHLYLLSNVYIIKNRKEIDKTLYYFSLISFILGIVMSILVGYSGGLIKRYQYDFLYLLYIPAIISILTILKINKDNKLIKILIVISILTLLYLLFQSFTGNGLLIKQAYNNNAYNLFKYLL